MSKTMNLTNKLFQGFVLERLREMNWKKGTGMPLVVELDPTAACNLACPGCISEDLVSVGKSFSGKRLIQLGHEFIDQGVKAIVLIGGGEPLIHHKIGEFIELMGKNDVHIGITTNGCYIDKHEAVIAKYSQWTRVSFDAASQKTFDRLRPAKNKRSVYEKVLDNMRKLAKVKQGYLGFSFLIRTKADGEGIIDNIHDIYDAAVLAKELGCDYFEIKPTYRYVNDVPHALMKHEPERMDAARKEIERLSELETDHFKIIKAINLKFSLDGVEEKQHKEYHVCPSVHLRTTVTPFGVYVCPYWRGKEFMKIGNVQHNSFQEVWAGERRKEVLAFLDAQKHCSFHCLRHKTNVCCFEIKNNLEKGNHVNEVQEFDRFI